MPKPKGSPKTGGRKKGSKNKRTKAIDKASAEGITPLQFMLEVMRDISRKIELRVDLAKAAAPYLHARRAAEDKKGNTIPPMIYSMPSLESED